MSGAKAKAPETAPLRIPGEAGEAPGRPLARAALRPAVNAAIAVAAAHKATLPGLDLNELVNELSDQALKVTGGDLGRVEAVLVSQLHTLDTMFSALLKRAMAQDALPQYEAHMRFALRAQAQARATAEAIGQLKNPTVLITRQANIGENIMVNNAVSRPVRAGAQARDETAIAPSELLGADDGSNRLDTGAAGAAGRRDPAVATVGEIDRAEDRGR